jgi:anaerobic magnesium-protoporphyrin IX monomethyl ester cyclase
MKILLIQPPIRDFYQTAIRTQPIGLAYLAGSLQSDGYDVEILDCQREKRRSISIPIELSYLRDFYPFNDRSPFKLYTGYYHFGMDWDEIRQKIKDSKADVFGISSSFTPYHGEALEITRMIKEWDKNKMVIMGGPHASCDPEGVLKSPFVDYVILGEGEIRLPSLLYQIEKGKKGTAGESDGVGYRLNGEIHIDPLQTFIQDLDSLPHPARELLDLDRYRMKRKRSTMIITSRGCPHGCAYCSTHLVMGASFRTRSPESILQEMMECHERYDINIFDIEDDNFTFDQERAKQLMNLIIETFGEGNLELTAMNGVSFASLDRELLELMKKAGFKTINLSFVSTDPSFRERMGRPRTTSDFDKVMEDIEQTGLNIIAYAILGMPDQKIEDMVDTLIYLMGKRVLLGASVYYPTPGTPLFEKCQEMDTLPAHPSQWRSSAFPIETEGFDRLDIVTLFRLARVINFVKGKIDEKTLNEGMTWKEIFQVTKAKAEAEAEVKIKSSTPCAMPYAPCNKGRDVTWMELLSSLFEERSFPSLRKDPGGRTTVVKEKSSKKVLDYFFEKAWERPILKSRHS